MKLFVNVLYLYFSVGTASASKRLELMPDPTPRLSTGVNYSWSKNKLSLPQKENNQLSGYFDPLINLMWFLGGGGLNLTFACCKNLTHSIRFKTEPCSLVLFLKLTADFIQSSNLLWFCPHKKLHFCSFSNLGNTCYMNAILQALFHLEPFTRDLVHISRRISRSLPQQSLYQSVFYWCFTVISSTVNLIFSCLRSRWQASLCISGPWCDCMDLGSGLCLTLLSEICSGVSNKPFLQVPKGSLAISNM